MKPEQVPSIELMKSCGSIFAIFASIYLMALAVHAPEPTPTDSQGLTNQLNIPTKQPNPTIPRTNLAAVVSSSSSPTVPVILDTDIGTDIDDTWALALLLRCPELDPKLILTETGDSTYRAKITAKFLVAANRTDIPIGLGINSKPMPASLRNQDPWIKDYDLAAYPGEIAEDGVGRMIRIIKESPVPVTIIAIAPSSNLAAALARAPGIAAHCHLVGMFGSFAVGYSGGLPASAETNVRVDPTALRTVLAAPWRDVLLTPLDTCNAAMLTGENYHRIWSATGDSTLRAVIENYCIFAPRVDWMNCDYYAVHSSTLFDCVAVYLAYSENLVETDTFRFNITDDGYTVRDDHGQFTARIALHWKNLPAFQDHLTTRLLHAPGKESK